MQRYDLDPTSQCSGESGYCRAEMLLSDDGDWVTYEEVKDLEAQLAEATATINRYASELMAYRQAEAHLNEEIGRQEILIAGYIEPQR